MEEKKETIGPMARVQELTRQVFEKNIHQRAPGINARLGILKSLFSVVDGFRFFMLSDRIYANDIWERIREDDRVTDFVLSATCELKLLVGDIIPWNNLITRLAESYCVLPSSMASDCVIEDDTLSMFPKSTESLRSLIADNPWLVFIILMSTLDVSNIIVNQIEDLKGKVGADEATTTNRARRSS